MSASLTAASWIRFSRDELMETKLFSVSAGFQCSCRASCSRAGCKLGIVSSVVENFRCSWDFGELDSGGSSNLTWIHGSLNDGIKLKWASSISFFCLLFFFFFLSFCLHGIK